MVPVISVRVADMPPAAGAAAGAEEGGVEADVTLPSGRPQEGLQPYLPTLAMVARAAMHGCRSAAAAIRTTIYGRRSGCGCCWRGWSRWPRASTRRSRCATVTRLYCTRVGSSRYTYLCGTVAGLYSTVLRSGWRHLPVNGYATFPTPIRLLWLYTYTY